MIRFVVDTSGKMEPESVSIVMATNPAFKQAVVATIGSGRFTPAVQREKHVRQVVQQLFIFNPKR